MKYIYLSLIATLFFSCAGSKGDTGYPFCDEGKKTQKNLMAMYQAYLNDPALKTEFNMERKRYDNQVTECLLESDDPEILLPTHKLLCGEDQNCQKNFK